MTRSRTGLVAGAALIVAVGSIAGCKEGRDGSGPPAVDLAAAKAASLDSVRMATERFQDVSVALAEGYADAWKAAGNAEPPAFLGVPYDYMIDDPATSVDEGHQFDPHYDRHVWLYRENPNGMFAQFNPNVSCAHHQGGGHGHPALAPG